MARHRKASQQSQQEEAQKTVKRSKTSEAPGRNKANPAVQRSVSQGDKAQMVLDLQRTVGNRAVGSLLTGSPPAVQRDALYEADEKSGGSTIAGSSAAKTAAAPGSSVAQPHETAGPTGPGSETKSTTMPKMKTGGAMAGNEPGTTQGMAPPVTAGAAPAPSGVGPSQPPVSVDTGGPTQEEGATPPAGSSWTQQPEEETGS